MGIHTQVPDPNQPGRTHAWITVEKDGVKRDYSLWKEGGLLEGKDAGKTPTASLYRTLTAEEESRFQKALAKPEQYSTRSNNCTHFSARIFEETTGQKLKVEHSAPNGVGGTQTVSSPVGLEQSIRTRELDPQTERREVTERPEQAMPERSAEERRADLTRRREEARAADRASLLSSLCRDDKGSPSR